MDNHITDILNDAVCKLSFICDVFSQKEVAFDFSDDGLIGLYLILVDIRDMVDTCINDTPTNDANNANDANNVNDTNDACIN
jgi:hypothetical protein